MDLPAVRQALADVIRSGIDAAPNVYPYLPSAPRFPCIAITAAPDWISPHESMGAVDVIGALIEVNFEILIGGTDRPEDALRRIDQLVFQVIDAVERENAPGVNGTLGGLVDSLVCRSVSALSEGDPNAPVYACSIATSVLARR